MKKGILLAILGLILPLIILILGGCGENDDDIVFSSDTTPPTVLLTTPEDGETAVPISTNITVYFSEEMDPESVIYNFECWIDVAGVHASEVPANRQGVTYGDYKLVFYPSDNLFEGYTYYAKVKAGAKDSAGNALGSDYFWSFTTINLGP